MKLAVPMLISFLFAAHVHGGEPQPAAKAMPRIVVEATYPGANAQVVADTVAAPIESQVNGVEGAVQLMSRCDNDGKYLLEVTFKPGVDLHKAILLVQNRVSLAMPALPRAVAIGGVMVKMKAPVCVVVCLSSPTGKHDVAALTNYAAVSLNDELLRTPGVGDMTTIGKHDPIMKVSIDPQKLVARKLTAGDVVEAAKQQNVKVAAEQIGQPPIPAGQVLDLTMQTEGRLADVKQFEEIVLKANGDGQVIYLRDVANVKIASTNSAGDVRFNGKPALALAFFPLGENEKETSKAIAAKLADLRKRLPEGLKLDVAFDGATKDDTFLLDVELPEGARAEDVGKVLSELEKFLRETADVQDVLTMTKSPFDDIRNRPGIVVRLTPANQRKASRDDVVKAIRTKLADLPGALIRLRELSQSDDKARRQDSIEMAVAGPDPAKVLELAKKLGTLLQVGKTLSDVAVDAESRGVAQVSVEFDREKATKLGISLKDAFSTLQVSLGSTYVNVFNKFGRTWQIVVSSSPPEIGAEELAKIRVRNSQGDLVPLKSFADVKVITGPTAIHRIDLKSAAFLSANRTAETSPKEARAKCEAEFEKARQELRLGAEYRLTLRQWRGLSL